MEEREINDFEAFVIGGGGMPVTDPLGDSSRDACLQGLQAGQDLEPNC